ncbi:MAG: hypothetical protein WBD86_01835 [Microgenomates group bacterium]
MFKMRFVNIDELLRTYKLSFDGDGILINSGIAVIQAFNNLFGTDHRLEDAHGWFVIAEWAMMAGASESEALELNVRLWTDPAILIKSPPMPGAVEFTKKLYEQGADICVATSRIPKLRETTLNWFKKWMPWIKQEKINIRTNNDVNGEIFKANVINQLGVRIHFEDDLEHARNILDRTNARVVFMPYTKEVFNIASNRVFQISILDDQIPDLWDAYRQLRSKDVYVAQY